jgi:radical SAM protein with 4Fe4S-binding SPASM domain
LAAEPHPLDDLLQRAEESARPVTALCELTHACNVDCEHCYLDLRPDRKIGALDTSEWKRIFGELADEGCVFLTLSGGEVLLRRDWEELALHARSLGFAIRFYTNGTLVTEEVADRMAAVRPMDIEISVLGGIALTHDAITRRKGAFDKTIAGIRRLRARGLTVLMKCVVMKRNVGEYAQMRALAKELDCDIAFDIEVTPKNNGSLKPTELTGDGPQMLEVTRAIYAAVEDDVVPREERAADTPCAAGRRTVQIGPTGDVFPCTSWAQPIGSLRTMSFRELWRGNETFAEIRTKRIGSFAVCARCEILDLCNPCMALSHLELGAIDGPSPTKCRATETKALALGKPGESAAFKEGLFARGAAAPAGALVQLGRRPRAGAETPGPKGAHLHQAVPMSGMPDSTPRVDAPMGAKIA